METSDCNPGRWIPEGRNNLRRLQFKMKKQYKLKISLIKISYLRNKIGIKTNNYFVILPDNAKNKNSSDTKIKQFYYSEFCSSTEYLNSTWAYIDLSISMEIYSSVFIFTTINDKFLSFEFRVSLNSALVFKIIAYIVKYCKYSYKQPKKSAFYNYCKHLIRCNVNMWLFTLLYALICLPGNW